jgi:hypothetical protein
MEKICEFIVFLLSARCVCNCVCELYFPTFLSGPRGMLMMMMEFNFEGIYRNSKVLCSKCGTKVGMQIKKSGNQRFINMPEIFFLFQFLQICRATTADGVFVPVSGFITNPLWILFSTFLAFILESFSLPIAVST